VYSIFVIFAETSATVPGLAFDKCCGRERVFRLSRQIVTVKSQVYNSESHDSKSHVCQVT